MRYTASQHYQEDEQARLTGHHRASQHFQENVFIEGSRPKHLQDLHTEAQEGLKNLLREGVCVCVCVSL